MSDVIGTSVGSMGALSRLAASFSKQGRDLIERIVPAVGLNRRRQRQHDPCTTLAALADALLSVRGEASGVAIAHDILDLYARCTPEEKRHFFIDIAKRLNPDAAALEAAWAQYKSGSDLALSQLGKAAEAPRQELFRRLNLAPGGTAALVRMRADLIRLLSSNDPAFRIIDVDLSHLLRSWFNRGFLEMRPISWSTSARVLESVIRFEAVHDISGWDDLRRRLDPPDRRCYAFVHPVMPEELLIFVEVALTRGLAGNVQELLRDDRDPLTADMADTAIFYSISNCQDGLRGISFGHFLIKQVAADLKKEFPQLSRFATLSPIPGLLEWVEKTDAAMSASLKNSRSQEDPGGPVQDRLLLRAAEYLAEAKDGKNRPIDPVARFHLGNGARLERLNWLADCSKKGLRQSAGIMVNYLYDLPTIEENHEAFAERGEVSLSAAVRQMLRTKDKGRLDAVAG